MRQEAQHGDPRVPVAQGRQGRQEGGHRCRVGARPSCGLFGSVGHGCQIAAQQERGARRMLIKEPCNDILNVPVRTLREALRYGLRSVEVAFQEQGEDDGVLVARA